MPNTFREWMEEQYGDDFKSTCSDIASHGVDCGFSGLTYYRETCKLYEEYENEIWDALDEDMEGMGETSILGLIASFAGAKDVGSDDQFRNLLVWYLAEKIAYAVDDEYEEEDD